jgi:hypothetical protein
MDEVTVGFDGYSLDDNDEENKDFESYVISIAINGDNKVSFYVDLENCLTGKPTVNEEYVEEPYNDDVAEQLESASCGQEKFEALVEELYAKSR